MEAGDDIAGPVDPEFIALTLIAEVRGAMKDELNTFQSERDADIGLQCSESFVDR